MAQRSSTRKPRSSGASRRSSKKSGASPVWAWLVAGLLAGLFIAFLIYLNGVESADSERSQPQVNSEPVREKQANRESQKAKEKERAAAKEAQLKERETASAPARSEPAKEEKATTPPAKEPAKAEPVTATKANTPAKSEPPPSKEGGAAKGATSKSGDKPMTYDFYKILPKSEVVVPEEDLTKPNSATATQPGTYYLQVGAFRRLEEADSRKAELAMLGIVSSIQTVTVEASSSWHRVRVGPVKDARQLERSKRQLQDNNITFVTIRENN